MLKVENIKHLKSLCNQGETEFCIVLNGGLLSRKIITYDEEKFYIDHLIDGSEEELTESELHKTNIPEAITKGAFFCEV